MCLIAKLCIIHLSLDSDIMKEEIGNLKRCNEKENMLEWVLQVTFCGSLYTGIFLMIEGMTEGRKIMYKDKRRQKVF